MLTGNYILLHPEHHDPLWSRSGCITCQVVGFANPAKETGGQGMCRWPVSWRQKYWIMGMRITYIRARKTFLWIFANRHLFFRLYSRGRYAPSIILFMAAASSAYNISWATDGSGSGGTSFMMIMYFTVRMACWKKLKKLRIGQIFFAYIVGRENKAFRLYRWKVLLTQPQKRYNIKALRFRWVWKQYLLISNIK